MTIRDAVTAELATVNTTINNLSSQITALQAPLTVAQVKAQALSTLLSLDDTSINEIEVFFKAQP